MPRASKAKKLVSVLAISVLVTGACKKAQVIQATQKVVLDWIPYIHYPVQFQKDKEATIQALIDSGSKINAMTLVYAKQVDLRVQRIDVRAQKIDGSLLRTFWMIIAGF